MKPTMEQIKYATDLLRKLGYDVADYDFEKMTRADEYYGRQEKTLSEYQKWLVSVHMEIDGTKID